MWATYLLTYTALAVSVGAARAKLCELSGEVYSGEAFPLPSRLEVLRRISGCKGIFRVFGTLRHCMVASGE